MSKQITVADIKHPLYEERYRDWDKWRRTYVGGQQFIDVYLNKFSSREGADNYNRRKRITYNPAFAKAAVDEIKNSLFTRFSDIDRSGGSGNYQDAIAGKGFGVDLLGSSMNSFVGRVILPELLVMSRVGIYVDMPSISGVTISETEGARPYVYIYKTEDIRSWTYDDDGTSNEFSNILLQDYYYTYDEDTGLASGGKSRYRRIWLKNGQVMVQFYDAQGEKTFFSGEKASAEEAVIALDIPRIPFVMVEITDSLLAEVANYQIALLNLASSDISYALQANYPFYTEQYDPRSQNEFSRRTGPDQGGESDDGQSGKDQVISVGPTQGRRYGLNLERPGFINPSPEPLQVSMEKQEQLKREIRQLVNLAVTSLQPKMASAESKGLDRQGLESGLSYIGLELENAERQVASYWAMYEKSEVATVFYPEDYSIKTPEERMAEAEQLKAQLATAPSLTYQKEIAKKIASLLVGRAVKGSVLQKIYGEIDAAPGMTSDPAILVEHVTAGFLDLATAAKLSGYPDDTVEKANKEHADRLTRIAETQAPSNGLVNGAARGAADGDPNPGQSGSAEKTASKDTTKDPVPKDKVRGDGN